MPLAEWIIGEGTAERGGHACGLDKTTRAPRRSPRFCLGRLDQGNAPGAMVVIHRIRGMITDTNPAAVAGAAIDAVWKATAYTAAQEQLLMVEDQVFESRGDEVPVFKT